MTTRTKTWARLAGLGGIVLLCALAWRFGATDASFWPGLVAHRAAWAAAAARHPIAAALLFIAGYAAAVAISLPVGLCFNLLAGLLFGTCWGGIVSILGASLGAIALFLLARALLVPFFAKRPRGRQMVRLQNGLANDAFAYLLAIRLLPIFPFWLVNLAPALIGMKLAPYAAATVCGIVPASFVLSAIGAGLAATLDAGTRPGVGMLLTPQILLPLTALAMLALLPVVWRQWQNHFRNRVSDSA
jgi:uncharacterized membrane protein YdjX (TVP38/TMEM64 family)